MYGYPRMCLLLLAVATERSWWLCSHRSRQQHQCIVGAWGKPPRLDLFFSDLNQLSHACKRQLIDTDLYDHNKHASNDKMQKDKNHGTLICSETGNISRTVQFKRRHIYSWFYGLVLSSICMANHVENGGKNTNFFLNLEKDRKTNKDFLV